MGRRLLTVLFSLVGALEQSNAGQPPAANQTRRTFAGSVEFLANIRSLRYLFIFSLDVFFAAFSLYVAFLARFEGTLPAEWVGTLVVSLFLLVAIRLGVNAVFGIHRWSFRLSGFHEAMRLAFATLTGSAIFVMVFYFLRHPGPPRSVVILEFFFTTTAMAAFRFSPRLASTFFVGQRQAREAWRRSTLIVGAGSAGDLLMRDLMRSEEHDYHVVGFVDDDPRKIGTLLHGRPVLGTIERLSAIAEKHGVTQVLIAVPRLPADRIRAILRLCSNLRISFKIVPVSFTYLNDRVAASMLHDLSPEDLLPRDQASFDHDEVFRLITGRRVLITGAGGSIGSEIARQVAACEPETLVLTDIAENDLYFLYRELLERHPGLKVVAEIADIREDRRVAQLGSLWRPHCVFHAAAHKHVPLMEEAPEEAVKNNVFGTWNVARMADDCGADRFVLISTDKAVRPSSVMGATKRIAEFLVRTLGKSSRTRFTAIRFGNVLGSAGSVVPLFRRQIEQGGPVTVTHPDCTRYFMTIPEAVGLVLLAGLGDYGDLCVLDMGQAIRILDLARHMITMAGLVPDTDVKIQFTGLRPGEKLSEELLTEEEERSRVVHSKIYATTSPPPPERLFEKLAELRRDMESGDREKILANLKYLIPTFDPVTPRGAELPMEILS